MKPKYAIHSSDSNPYYLDFWPLVSRVWKEKFGLEPVLIYIDDNHDVPIDTTYGIVIKLKPVERIPVYLQCLWVRYWYPSQFPDDVSIICDIDMFPISKTYFLTQIQSVSDDAYVHLNPNSAIIPSCYHVAKGSTFVKVLNLDPRWEDSIQKVWKSPGGIVHTASGITFGKWGVDEAHATELINKYEDKSIFTFIPRTHRRIDRAKWVYTHEEIEDDTYADIHSVRPYSEYKDEIDKLVQTIMRV